MKKIKQFANNAFRPDRTEVLTESLQEAERRIDQIKLTCESLAKKVHDCLQVKGKDAVIEKRIRKVPEFLLGSAMINNGKSLGDGSILGEVLAESGQIEMKLGQEVVKYEVQIEESILKPLQTLMEHDLPSIYKLKRQLAKYTGDMDIAKAKLGQVNRHSSALTVNLNPGQPVTKADSIREEYDEALGKVEQCRDNLAAEMYSLIARESEISRLIVDFLNYQKDYHSSVYAILSELICNVDAAVASSMHKPVYGQGLEDHLRSSGRIIAYPLELCVCALLESGLEEEGLFRIAGSTSKVKKLKAAFDATLMDLEGLLEEFCDVHVIANALKCYLRELSEPLLTFQLYNDWITAVRIQDSNSRQEALWRVLEKMPKTHHDNLRYLVKFLKELSTHADSNKMSPANIAIVIAPNLLWSAPPPPSQTNSSQEGDLMGDSSQMGLNMTMTHLYSSILEQLISNCAYFFPDEIDFFVTCSKPIPASSSSDHLAVDLRSHHQHHIGLVNGSSSLDEGSSSSYDNRLKRTVSNSSDIDQFDEPEGHSPPPPHGQGSPKPILRRKNKPAPTPPTQKTTTTNKNPLANSFNSGNKPLPFSGAGYGVSAGQNSVSNSPGGKNGGGGIKSGLFDKEKREGVWIPPSPKDTNNRRKLEQNQPPVKPPPPTVSTSTSTSTTSYNPTPGGSGELSSAKQKFMESSSSGGMPPPKPESPLRYKSSFKANSVESNNTSSTPTAGNKTGSSTTDNITREKGGNSGNSGSSFGANAANFASLPRHFHTENSYKNGNSGGKATPPARPPSMFGIPPPAPPTTSTSSQNEARDATIAPVPEYQAPGGQAPGRIIGFEKVESEVRKESIPSAEEVDEVKPNLRGHHGQSDEGQPQPAFTRPIPAPRSSLLSQSHSFKDTTSTNSGEGTSNTTPTSRPEVRERPSIMAKPRDLSKRNLSNNSNPDEANTLNPIPSQSLESTHNSGNNSGSSGSGGEEDVPKNNNVLPDSPTATGQGPQLYPNLSFSHRPPRPQPPAPPATQNSAPNSAQNSTPKTKISRESTDL